jgi:hypothetical protein
MKNESSARVMLGNVLGPAITARAWSTYMVWLVDSLSIGRLLVTVDVASVCALFVANLQSHWRTLLEVEQFLGCFFRSDGTGMGNFAAATVAASTISAVHPSVMFYTPRE